MAEGGTEDGPPASIVTRSGVRGVFKNQNLCKNRTCVPVIRYFMPVLGMMKLLRSLERLLTEHSDLAAAIGSM